MAHTTHSHIHAVIQTHNHTGAYRETQKGEGGDLEENVKSLTKCPKRRGGGEGPSPSPLCTPMHTHTATIANSGSGSDKKAGAVVAGSYSETLCFK